MKELLRDITAGDLQPGESTAREVDLVERFHISRTTVREALRGLEERGVARVRHGVAGATVTDPSEWDVFDPEVFEALLDSPQAEQFEAETLECQRLLEVEAAALAAGRADEADREALSAAVEQMAKAAGEEGRGRGERYHQAHIDFHVALVRASGNRAIERLSRPLHRALASVAPLGSGALDEGVEEHRRILDAIARRKAKAAREAMAAHLSAG
jgi:GntR family transcriptional regulator, galactonate operon transcriptional repressor